MWCHLLHGSFIAFHIALAAISLNHIEHHITIPLDSMGTTILKALLQLFYTVCSFQAGTWATLY